MIRQDGAPVARVCWFTPSNLIRLVLVGGLEHEFDVFQLIGGLEHVSFSLYLEYSSQLTFIFFRVAGPPPTSQ